MKDDGKDHFEFVYHDLSANDMNEDKLEYTKCGRIGLNNWVSPDPKLCTTCARVVNFTQIQLG